MNLSSPYYEIASGRLITERAPIRRHYLRGYAILDALVALPYEILFAFAGYHRYVHCIICVRVLKMLQWPRLW